MARVLSDSWTKFYPDYPFYVLLLDSARGFFSPENEDFRILFASDLGIPNLDGFLFKYSILEASTGVKPYLCNYLLHRHNIDKLLYLDPDIHILNSLDSLRHYLDDANILLTPHLLSPFPDDGRTQSEHDILQAGTYNLGFLALRNNLESKKFLRWWSAKLYHHCLAAVENNLFVDQRWMDMVPSLFDGVKIIREPEYNVAYWNLHERVVSVGDQVLANGRPLRFFHFSGFDADRPWIVSKYQDRFSMTSSVKPTSCIPDTETCWSKRAGIKPRVGNTLMTISTMEQRFPLVRGDTIGVLVRTCRIWEIRFHGSIPRQRPETAIP